MNSKPGWACALLAFIIAGTAHAQAAPPARAPEQYLAHISIHAAPSTELEVVPAEGWTGTGPVARCTEYCDFWALPGKYTLYALDHTTGERKDLSLRIKQSSRFELQAGDDDARSTGLVLGIAGSAAILTGFVLVAPLLLASTCEDSHCTTEAQENAAGVGLAVLLAGAVITPIGWAMYAGNRTRLKRIEERSYAMTETTSQVRLGVVGVGRGGLGLGALVSF